MNVVKKIPLLIYIRNECHVNASVLKSLTGIHGIVGMNSDRNLRKLFFQLRKYIYINHRLKIWSYGKIKNHLIFIIQTVKLLLCQCFLTKYRTCPVKINLSRIRQHHLFLLFPEKRRNPLLLQLRKLLGKCRLGDIHLLRRKRQIPGLRNGNNIFKLFQIHNESPYW